MRRRVFSVCFVIALLLFPGTVLWATDMLLPRQYEETYYGELSDMYERLKAAKGSRIILIGGSSLAFGADIPLLESELPGYTVCSFGLYGAIGTKAMIDLAKSQIRKGDIVIVAPEISEQTMSLYFSPEDMWRAVDGNYELLRGVKWENMASMANTASGYVADKLKYWSKGVKISPSDVYAHSSFDEKCSMIFERSYNIMPQMYDSNTMVSFSENLIKQDFIEYLNGFCQYWYKKEAQIYYNFCPVNRLAVTDETEAKEFAAALSEKLQFPVLGNPEDYIFDADWFYDSNFHMNTPGMTVYSSQLLEELKLAAEVDTTTRIELPEKSVIPQEQTGLSQIDDTIFLYEKIGEKYQITGVTEKGKKEEILNIPASVTSIKGGSFAECTGLKQLVLEAEFPECAVDSHLLDEKPDVQIVLTSYESYLNYVVNYYWSQYADHMIYQNQGF